MNPLLKISAVLALVAGYVAAESHTVSFNNRCGSGTPTLVSQKGVTLSTGLSYTSNGSFPGAIAYLQNGGCGLNGEHCTMVETTLVNPTCAGCGSSADITLIEPHEFSVATGFEYYNGCDGTGATCASANCVSAFHKSTDTAVQVACQTNDVNLRITFC